MKKNICLTIMVFICILSLFALSGCKNSTGTENKIESNEIKPVSGNPEAEVKGEFDFRDKESYYILINGNKFTIEDKLRDIQVAGYSQDATSEEIDVSPKAQVVGGVFFRNADNKTVFSVIPINTSDETVKCSDANIGGFTLDKYYYKDIEDVIEICNGISIGTSVEKLEKTFGMPTEKDMREGYDNLGIKYTYKAGIYKYMEFEIDKESQTITSITWRYFDL